MQAIPENKKALFQHLSELSRYPLRHALPLCIYNPEDKNSFLSNGTVTFFELEEYIIGITCQHILEEYDQKIKENKGLKFQIGQLIFDPYDYLFQQSKLDLIIFKFPKIAEKQLKPEIDRGFGNFLIQEIYNQELKVGQFVAVGGFPGVWREKPSEDNRLVFKSASMLGHVTSSCEDQFCCRMENVNSWYKGLDNVGKNLTKAGGFSGGPVFVINEEGIIYPTFAGIIYEGDFYPGTDILMLFVRPAKYIQMNGLIS